MQENVNDLVVYLSTSFDNIKENKKDKFIKIHTKELNNNQLITLVNCNVAYSKLVKNITAKRSGTGITTIINLN